MRLHVDVSSSFQMLSVSCSTDVRLQACSYFKNETDSLICGCTKDVFKTRLYLACSWSSSSDPCPSFHSVLFQDDDPITGGANGRENVLVRKFLSQRHKKVPWKPEVISLPFIWLLLWGFLLSPHQPFGFHAGKPWERFAEITSHTCMCTTC